MDRHPVLVPIWLAGCLGPQPTGADLPVFPPPDLVTPAGREDGGAPGCGDGEKGGDESDIDCGGSVCGPCGSWHGRGRDGDCASGLCRGGLCVTRPPVRPCANGRNDGRETGIDCGGGDCPECRDGEPCSVGSDCSSGSCGNGHCSSPASCANGRLDLGESDVDCGGCNCQKCVHGRKCATRDDCAGLVCVAGRCDTCKDSILDGRETGLDCGGPDCPPCQRSDWCAANRDCLAGECDAGSCTAKIGCQNGRRDPGDTDVDCGGPRCFRCPDGRRYVVGDDCMNGLCKAGVCVHDPACDLCARGQWCRAGLCRRDDRSCPSCCDGPACDDRGTLTAHCLGDGQACEPACSLGVVQCLGRRCASCGDIGCGFLRCSPLAGLCHRFDNEACGPLCMPLADSAMVLESDLLLAFIAASDAFVLAPRLSFRLHGLGSIALGSGFAGIGMGIGHDAIHGAYARRELLNRLLGCCFDRIGASRHAWRYAHNREIWARQGLPVHELPTLGAAVRSHLALRCRMGREDA